jgi:hypothetical protein
MKQRFLKMGLAAAAALGASAPAAALTIGDIDVKSHLGQRFSARIPLVLQAGEDVVPTCVRLDDMPGPNRGVPMLAAYTLTLEPAQGGKSAVLLSTASALTEPVVRIGLVIRCGQKTSSSREFIVNQKLADTAKKK